MIGEEDDSSTESRPLIDAEAFWRTYEHDRDARRLRQALLTPVGQAWLRELTALPPAAAVQLLAELILFGD
jgi:hypothetical protein